MTRHQEFLTEEFPLYASECKRMAAIARPRQSNATKTAVTGPKWTELLDRIAARHGQPQASYPELGHQPAYA